MERNLHKESLPRRTASVWSVGTVWTIAWCGDCFSRVRRFEPDQERLGIDAAMFSSDRLQQTRGGWRVLRRELLSTASAAI